jgi:XapX domain-containing protein
MEYILAAFGPSKLVFLKATTGVVQAFTLGIDAIKAFIVGLLISIVFSWFDLPIPAPSILGGILAIWGVFIG